MVGNKNWKIILSISLVLLALVYLLDRYISQTEEALYDRLELSVVNDMSDIAKNVDRAIKGQTSDREKKSLFEYLRDSSGIRNDFENRFNLLISTKMKYVYLIYKDKSQKFRYLIDGSSEDKARFNEKFDAEALEYRSIYISKEALAIKQSMSKSLFITYLYPIIHNGEVEALLVFDFSSAFEYELREIIKPLKTIFILIYTIVCIFLIVMIVQTFFYYEARKRSYVDALTGYYNRQYLRYFLDKNNISDYQIMMIDFDYFKKINDKYGHDIGDKMIVFATKIIKSALLDEDKAFRYGGEEFLVLVYKNNDVYQIAESIRKMMDEKHFLEANIDINMTVSIGVNAVPAHARNTSQAINIADSMLYQAKAQGRNRVVSHRAGIEMDIEKKT